MTTLNLQVTASAADGYENGNGDVTITGDYISCYGSSNPYIGLRFAVGIPHGAVLSSAVLSVYPYVNDDPNMHIYGEDVDSSAGYEAGSATYTISTRTKTTAYVDWVARDIGTGVWKDSPDISAVIQEIVDRWESGNYLGLILQYIDSDPAGIMLRSWDYSDHSLAAKLAIEYTEGSGLR